jgi:hypothetical protein
MRLSYVLNAIMKPLLIPGNIQIIGPLLAIILLLFVSVHKRLYAIPEDEAYRKSEKDGALDAFAMSLLLARDQRLKTTSGHFKSSVISDITDELSAHTMLSDQSHKVRRVKRLHVKQRSSVSRTFWQISAVGRMNRMKQISAYAHSEVAVSPAPTGGDSPVIASATVSNRRDKVVEFRFEGEEEGEGDGSLDALERGRGRSSRGGTDGNS